MSDAEHAQPRPIRFFGTTWVNHDGGYPLRRAAVAVGSLAAAAAGAVVVDFAYQGFDPTPTGAVLRFLFAAALAVCTVAAFRRTWTGFVRRAEPGTGSDAARGMMMIGFIGVLLAYFLRSLVEAPGEGLCRAEYERSLTTWCTIGCGLSTPCDSASCVVVGRRCSPRQLRCWEVPPASPPSFALDSKPHDSPCLRREVPPAR